ncbi:MAG: thymidylate synthase [Armatimonadetes bacterium]|nr:thymidylate synthase [Armatimonadota bacterium]
MPENASFNRPFDKLECTNKSTEPSGELVFVPLHFGHKLRIVNPRGRLGIITLWSKIDFVHDTLAELGTDLDPHTSKIAVIGNLYGNGIPHLLRNLLYNPQIRDLIICGADRSGSANDLAAFFDNGLEEAEIIGERVTRIRGTTHIIDDLVTPEKFAEKPRLFRFGELRDKKSRFELYKFIQSFDPEPPISSKRIEIPLPEVHISRFPSEPRSHCIVKESPLDAWRELVFRLVRFGHLAHLRKGDRQELQNVKVVILDPRPDDPGSLSKYNFAIDELIQYQQDMLNPDLPPDQSYTYGSRIREYFGFDALSRFATRLRENPEDRDCYLALWDSRSDIDAEDAPCLVSLFFRVFDAKLTLTATYRTHNALDAWLKNVYGLIKVQEIVANETGIEMGPLTVISHSISIDPARYEFARRVAESKTLSIDIDPNGYFVISIDDETREIVAHHMSNEGIQLREYRSKKAERIQHEIARDCAISDINHAIYVGRQLAIYERYLETGESHEES